MNTANKAFLVIAFVIVLALFLLFGGGALAGARFTGGMMGAGMMGGFSWMWIPTVIALGLGILLGWAIFAKK